MAKNISIEDLTIAQLQDLIDELGYDVSDLTDIEILAGCTGTCVQCNGTCMRCVSACTRCVSGGLKAGK